MEKANIDGETLMKTLNFKFRNHKLSMDSNAPLSGKHTSNTCSIIGLSGHIKEQGTSMSGMQVT